MKLRIPRPHVLPQSLAGWFLLIVIAALLLTLLTSFVGFEVLRSEFSAFTERDTTAERVLTLDRLLATAPQSVWPEFARALDAPAFRIQLTAPDPSLVEQRAIEDRVVAIARQVEQAQRTSLQLAARVRGGVDSGAQGEAARRALASRIAAEAAGAEQAALALKDEADPIARIAADLLLAAARKTASEAPEIDAANPGPDFTVKITQSGVFGWFGDLPGSLGVHANFSYTTSVLMDLISARLDPSWRRRHGGQPAVEECEDDCPADTALADSIQRISPFITLWDGPQFEHRPFLLPSPGPDQRLRIILPASDSQWVTIDGGDLAGATVDLRPTLRAFLLIALAIILLVIIAIVRMTAPLRRFAMAAERLGRDVEAPPLRERGTREVRQAIRALNEMQANVQRFVRDRTTMLAAISHDLRTPLTRLRLRGEFMPDDQRDRFFRDLDEMEAMIASTMSFARDEANEEAPMQLDLAALVQIVSSGFAEGGRPVQADTPRAVWLIGQAMALKRAIANLVENALTYGGVARLTLRADRKSVVLIVDDDGPGIAPEQRERVFAPFYRIEQSRSRATGGVGLGLATARTIARRHRGDVTLANRSGGGLRVTLTLPRA